MARVLLVEDDPDVTLVLVTAMEDAGHRIIVAATYEAAWQSLLAEPWDAVVADVVLPGNGDGKQIADKAHQMGIPCLVISGALDVVAWLSEQAEYAALEKPFRVEELLQWLRTVERT